MSAALSARGRSAACNGLTVALDGGRLRLYAGPRPASPDTAPDASTLLVDLVLPSPAFGLAINGVAHAQPIGAGMVIVAGRPSWFRAVDASGVAVIDGDVGARGSGAECTLAHLDLVAGQFCAVDRWTHSQP